MRVPRKTAAMVGENSKSRGRNATWIFMIAIASAACATRTGDQSTEIVGSSSSALANAFNDVSAPASNTVVALALGNCVGTMITPKLVLTASHCINGYEPDACASGTPPAITVGVNDSDNASSLASVGVATEVVGCVDESIYQGLDVALVYADPLGKSQYAPATTRTPFIENVAFTRPSFQRPNANDLVGVAGWGQNDPSPGLRQARIFSNLSITDVPGLPASPLGYTWIHSGSDIQTGDGDSGGPLFIARSNGNQDPYTWTRDPIGVLKGLTNQGTGWPDITSPTNQSWISYFALDANASCGGVPHLYCNHTQGWLSRHGRTADNFWYGEVDWVLNKNCSDVDGDHWCDEHDNCPFVANTDQAESFDNGIGDACRLCPCDPLGDPDGDGVCGLKCVQGSPGCPQFCGSQIQIQSEADNCPYVKNPLQENCNAFSEQVQGSDVLGDACDPVPCPQTDTDTVTNNVKCTLVDPSAGPGDPNYQAMQCAGYAVHDTAHLEPIAAHVRAPATTTPVSATVTAVPTTARYCQARSMADTPNGQSAFVCRNTAYINDGQLTDTDGDYRTPQKPWHGITTNVLGKQLVFRNGSFATDYDSASSLQAQWLYQGDLAFWISNPADPIIPLPNGNPNCVGTAGESGSSFTSTCLSGTIWYHDYSPIGSNNTNDTVGSGTSARFVGVHAPQLANDYSDLTVDDNTVGYCPTVNPEIAITAAAVANEQKSGPAPVMVWPLPIPGSMRRGFDIRSRPDTEIIASTNLGPAMIQDNGSVIATHDLVGPNGSANCGGSSVNDSISPLFDGFSIWANAVEPDSRIGRHPENISFVVSTDGSQILNHAVSSNGVLTSGIVCPNCDERLLATAASAPSSRSKFAVVYSRAANGVIVAGGEDATHRPLHDVWLYDVDATAWQQITPSGIDVGEIADVTYSFADQHFWMVDRVSHDWAFDTIRILRFDGLGNDAKIMRSWPVLRNFEPDLLLALDRDGSALLTVSARHAYSVVRLALDREGVASAHLVDVGQGDLAYRPIVSSQSYAFLRRERDGTVRVERKANLSSCDDRFESERDRRAVESCFR